MKEGNQEGNQAQGSGQRIDYRILTQGQVPIRKTAQAVWETLKKENPRDSIPEFANYFFSKSSHDVPKGAEIMKNIVYQGRLFDLHITKKTFIDEKVVYLVSKS